MALMMLSVAFLTNSLIPHDYNHPLDLGVDLGDIPLNREQINNLIDLAEEQYNLAPHMLEVTALHLEAIGCVKATFTIDPSDSAAIGLFSVENTGKTFEAWVRFSHNEETLGISSMISSPTLSVKVGFAESSIFDLSNFF